MKEIVKVLVLALFITSIILAVEAMWCLDCAMWGRSVYSYYPWEWGTHYGKNGKPLGDIVNMKYYQIAISLIILGVSAFILGREIMND